MRIASLNPNARAERADTPCACLCLARLSALVFLVSYSSASLGPFLFGAVHDATGGFTASFAGLLALAVVQMTLVPRVRPGRLTEPVRQTAEAGSSA